MKKFLYALGISMAMVVGAGADLVYSTDFTTSYTSDTTPTVFGGAAPEIGVEEWFGSSNGVGVSGDDLSFANSTSNRWRGAGVWLDPSTWATGLVTVEIDVANYVDGADTEIIFQAFSATGVDASNSVGLDLHGAVSTTPGLSQTGTAAISLLGVEQEITANGTDVAFTFNYTGAEQFVAVAFGQRNAAAGTSFGSADLDNLSVNTVPEPSSLVLFGLGAFGMFLNRLKKRA